MPRGERSAGRCAEGLDGATVVVRPLPCLMPIEHNPAAAEVERAAEAWARDRLGGVVDTDDLDVALDRRSPSWLVPSCPTGSAERLLKLWKLDQVYFLLDDACVAGPSAAPTTPERCLELAEQILGRAAPATATERFLLGLVRDVADDMTPGLRERTLVGMATMLTAFAEELVRTRDGLVVDWDTAVDTRVRSAGAPAFLTWAEYLAGVDMTPSFDRHPLLRTLAGLAGKQATFVNELCSFRKEHFAGDHTGLVCVALSAGATLQDAFDLVAGCAAQAERDFVALRDVATAGPAGGEPDVLAYLDALGHLISGATHWQYTAVRYHGPGFRGSPAVRSTWRMHPDRTETVGRAPGARDPHCRCAAARSDLTAGVLT